MAVRYVGAKTPGLLPSASAIWDQPDTRAATAQADVSSDNVKDEVQGNARGGVPGPVEDNDAARAAAAPEPSGGPEVVNDKPAPAPPATAERAAVHSAAAEPIAPSPAQPEASPSAAPADGETRKPAASVSPDYYAIVASAIAGLTHNTAATRREFYDHARRIVEERLQRIEPAPPSHVVATEKVALERAIKRIEAEQIEAAFRNVADVPAAEPVKVEPEPALRAPAVKPAPRRTEKAARLPGGALVRAFILMAAIAAGLFAYWLSSGRFEALKGTAPAPVAAVPSPASETAAEPAATPAAATSAPAPASDTAAGDAPPSRYLRDLTDRLAVCDPATDRAEACANLRPAPPDLSVPGAMPSWVASNASMAGLRPPRTVTQWPTASGASPLASGGDAATASATSGKIVSGPAREKFEAGKARLAADDVEGAIANFGEAARLDPKFDDAFIQRGQAYFKIGNVERAIADFSQALRIDPRNALAYKARGMALLYKNDTDGAIIDLTKAIQYAEIDPGSISTLEVFYARRSRSALYDQKQLYDRELIDLSAMIDGFWKNPELAATLKGTYGEAGAAALVASIYRLRSLVHLKRKSVDSAVGDLSFALQLDPAHALQFLVERARIQEKAGRNEQAAADYQQALDLNPKNDDLKAALARVRKHS